MTTATGVIASVALAAGPLISASRVVVPAEALWFAGVGAISFAAGIVCGNLANMPRNFDVAKATALARVISPQFWNARRSIGSRRSAEVRLDELISARKANSAKATWLRIGYALHVFGIAALGAAAALVIGFNPQR